MILGFGTAPASADVVQAFSLQALFAYKDSNYISGPSPYTATLLIDTTVGTVVSVQPLYFSDPVTVRQGPDSRSNTYFWSVSPNYLPGSFFLDIDTPTLIGYTGGALVDFYHPDSVGDYTLISEVHVPPQVLVSGSLTPLPIPEASSLTLLAAGAFGSVAWRSGIFARSRHRRATA